jgi:hypothetical protein
MEEFMTRPCESIQAGSLQATCRCDWTTAGRQGHSLRLLQPRRLRLSHLGPVMVVVNDAALPAYAAQGKTKQHLHNPSRSNDWRYSGRRKEGTIKHEAANDSEEQHFPKRAALLQSNLVHACSL